MRGQKPDTVVTSDASGTWGCGAFSGTQWLQLQWPPCWVAYSIAPKELPLLSLKQLSGESNGPGRQYSSAATTQPLSHASARAQQKTGACSIFYVAWHSWQPTMIFTASHLPGAHNQAADAISHNRSDLFLSLCSQANPKPSQLPQ